jgi:hypothetical protein
MLEKMPYGKGHIYKHVETERLYQRIKGGFSWPGTEGGYVCVVAEYLSSEMQDYSTLQVLQETRETSIEGLAKLLSSLQNLFFVDYWICKCDDEWGGCVDMLRDWEAEKKGKDKTKQSFSFISQMLTLNTDLIIGTIGRRFGKNTLRFPKDGPIARKIQALNQEDSKRPGLMERYPEILTLANVIHAFDRSKYNPNQAPHRPDPPPSPMAV